MATAFSLSNFLAADRLPRARVVAKGLPNKALRDLLADPAITITDLSRVIAPRRTLDRRLKERQSLTREESDRLAQFVLILDLAGQVFGERAIAMEWLRTPKKFLDNDNPLDLMNSATGAAVIEERLLQAKHSFFA
ncbi:DUF2384 domain-containing protein [Sphingomonas paeninsulae]|jgi:putative toxin-antitoxin system antitoxin component (TIGR02293 family)|uniref:DUF2384 domain-containing protein n=1 Tax=Sphingomonas paeninsulae TaxID=2319844 RepID=A0A494TJH9_SPHPE|nr:antitoxin Xre/MbcA/ParS toxin-binding domain-containing protein [Sphingomonas paeninsulae]AYJ85921.1 DUF2384 domain-containing protein [Sphingomonas paeninsulae]